MIMRTIFMRILVVLVIIGVGALVNSAQSTSTKLEKNRAGVTFTLKAGETKFWNTDVKKNQPICLLFIVDVKNVVLTFNSQVVAANATDMTCFTPSTTADGNYEIKLVNNGNTIAKGTFEFRKEIQY